MIEVREEPVSVLHELAAIPISFEVRTILDVQVAENGSGGITLAERAVAPYVKDYDIDAGEGPSRWASRFDASHWAVFGAWHAIGRVGSVVIAWRTPGVHMLEGREDLGVLWDLRVHPTYRGRGVGTALFAAAEKWIRRHRGTLLKVETQNVNVAACRFYERMGCTLGGINRFAYPSHPGETQLLWYKPLRP